MPNIYGVRVQPIDGDVSLESLEKYGEVVDLTDLMGSDDRGRDFCDGQTSPLPPNHADDRGGMIWTYDEDTAKHWSGVVRRDVAERVAAGDIVIPSPSWANWSVTTITDSSVLSSARYVDADTVEEGLRQIRAKGYDISSVESTSTVNATPEMVNNFGHAIDRLEEQGIEIHKRLVFEDLMNDTLGEYAPSADSFADGVISINTRAQYWSNPDQYFDEMVRTHHFVDAGDAHTNFLVHETGHARHFISGGADFEYSIFGGDIPDIETMEQYNAAREMVSKYAATNQAEFVAEVYTGRAFGLQYDDYILGMFEEFGGAFP